MDRKICFFDIDGTLLSEDGTIPRSTEDALRRAADRGHLLFVNTGRTRYILPHELKKLPLTGMVCGCGTFIQVGETVLYHHRTSHEECVAMVREMEGWGMGAAFEQADRVSFNPRFDGHPKQQSFQRLYASMGLVNSSTREPDFTYDKFFAWREDDRCLPQFRAYLGDRYGYIYRGPVFCEIVPAGCSKATGMERLLRHYGLSREDAYAFGDSENDHAMLQYAGTAIAMGVSHGLEDVTDFTTLPLEEGGIAYAMEHFGLI